MCLCFSWPSFFLSYLLGVGEQVGVWGFLLFGGSVFLFCLGNFFEVMIRIWLKLAILTCSLVAGLETKAGCAAQSRGIVCHTATYCFTRVTTASAQVGKWTREQRGGRGRGRGWGGWHRSSSAIEDTKLRSFRGQQEAQKGQAKKDKKPERVERAGQADAGFWFGSSGLLTPFTSIEKGVPCRAGWKEPKQRLPGVREVDTTSQLQRQSLDPPPPRKTSDLHSSCGTWLSSTGMHGVL